MRCAWWLPGAVAQVHPGVDRWRRTRDTLLPRDAATKYTDIALFQALKVTGGTTSRRLDAEWVGYILKGLVATVYRVKARVTPSW